MEVHSDDETHVFARQKVRSQALDTQVTETTAFSFTRTSLWGLSLATYTAFYEQV